jgi:hypothetical protein
MKLLLLLLAPVLCAWAADPEIESAISLARSVGGEFASDAFIRIAALDRLPEARRIELLEEAFAAAAHAQQAFRRRPAFAGPGIPAAFYVRVYSQELDGLSLRVRSTSAMLPLDARKARDMFGSIPPLNLTAAGCGEILVPQVDAYYTLLAAVARRTFTAAETARGEPQRLLSYQASLVTSAVQVAPMAGVLAQSGLGNDAFLTALAAFAGALKGIVPDGRAFWAAHEAGPAVAALAAECRRRGLAQAPLVEAYRVFLVNHLSAKSCADGPGATRGLSAGLGGGAEAPEDPVAHFNQSLRVEPVQPIQPDEIVPAASEGRAGDRSTCRDTACRAVAERFRALLLNPEGVPYPNNFRSTTEWRAAYADFMAGLASWNPATGDDQAEHYRAKTGFLLDVANLAAGAERETALRALLDFTGASGFAAENRLEWLLPVNALMAHAALDPGGAGRLAAALRDSANPAIALYARLEALAPRAAARLAALL